MEIDSNRLPIIYRKMPSGAHSIWLLHVHIASVSYSEVLKSWWIKWNWWSETEECKDKKEVDIVIRTKIKDFLIEILADDNV